MARPKKYSDRFIKREAIRLIKYAKTAEIPLKQEFASLGRYPSEYLSVWANKYEWFSRALKRFEDIQQKKLITGAMKGRFHAAFTIFTLKNIAGWRDAYDLKHDGKLAETKIQIINYGANNPSSESGVPTSRLAIESSSEV